MDLHSQPIAARIEWLFSHARAHAESFSSPDTWLARELYLAKHPTSIAVMKCMDGRVNFPVATETPIGILQPFRNLGGRFDLGWPHLGETVSDHVLASIRKGRGSLFIASYHFSRGDPLRGCAGFNYDTSAAREHTFAIRRQLEMVFGSARQSVYPLACGFETDEEAILLHSPGGETLDIASLSDPAHLPARVRSAFPDMPERMLLDLIPLLEGNFRHIARIRQSKRELDVEHREWMICVGRGFEWLHMHNQALIIGPYSPDLADPIRKAASIIQSNMRAGRIPDDGFLLLASSPYSEIGPDRSRADLKARFLSEFSADVISREFPKLARKMIRHTAVLNLANRNLEIALPA